MVLTHVMVITHVMVLTRVHVKSNFFLFLECETLLFGGPSVWTPVEPLDKLPEFKIKVFKFKVLNVKVIVLMFH